MRDKNLQNKKKIEEKYRRMEKKEKEQKEKSQQQQQQYQLKCVLCAHNNDIKASIIYLLHSHANFLFSTSSINVY